jgi:hypothetical protein
MKNERRLVTVIIIGFLILSVSLLSNSEKSSEIEKLKKEKVALKTQLKIARTEQEIVVKTIPVCEEYIDNEIENICSEYVSDNTDEICSEYIRGNSREEANYEWDLRGGAYSY